MSDQFLQHMRVLEPHPNVLAFYDGRVTGHTFMAEQNWVDDGALSLGIASYAILSGEHALVYDTHISLQHARAIRQHLMAAGVKHFTGVLSHWHLDHVAGTEAFADCTVIANHKTFTHLRTNQAAIEAATSQGPPAIKPLILPDRFFSGHMTVEIGALSVELFEANIHSDDATVAWIKDRGIMLAGDTMEDTVTYVGEPDAFDLHLSDLERMAALEPLFILPNHGDPGIISAGGYHKGFIKAQQQYIRMLKRCRHDPVLRKQPLEELIAGPLSRGWINMFEPYRAIHAQNLERVLESEAKPG